MAAAQRMKGQRGETELANLLSAELGVPVKRMLGQERDGGADIHLGDLRIQVKRCEHVRTHEWWCQTLRDAGEDIPVLAYRPSRRPWMFRMLLSDVSGELPYDGHDMEWVEMPLSSFLHVVREYIPLGVYGKAATAEQIAEDLRE